MWRLWSRILNAIASLGLPPGFHRTRFRLGDPQACDSEGGMAWKDYCDTRRLWEVWGPLPDSPWLPYHCVTLFAALDHLNGALRPFLGPASGDDAARHLVEAGGLPGWARTRDTMLVLDLPATQLVVHAFHLAARAGFQPVCTFDNWPNERGVANPEAVLGGLLHYAAAMAAARVRLAADSPPMWLCDAGRCRSGRPAPGRYDNRYIIEDRLLPGPQMLAKTGIRRTLLVSAEAPPVVAAWDMHPYLKELERQGIEALAVSTTSGEAFHSPRPLAAEPGKSWNTLANNVMRTSAGGFGGFVPQPSSGG